MNDTLCPVEPMSLEDRDKALDSVVRRVRRYGLETPALFFLEMHRPLASLAGMASFMVTPLFGAFLGLNRVEQYASLIGDADALDTLIARLDASREEKRAGAPEPDAGG
jgi:hypothetical protein